MLKRTITGLVILLLTAGFIALRQVSPYFFDGFIAVLMYGSIVEMALTCKFSNKKVCKVSLFIYPAILVCIYVFSKTIEMTLLLQLLSILAIFLFLVAKELATNAIKRKHGEQISDEKELNSSLLNETKDTMQILLYPTTLLGFMLGINHFGLNIGYVGIIMTFAISMFTDVFAYLFGTLIKGVKLCPEISPNKSVAGMVFGAIGGIVACGLSYLAFVHFGLLGNVFANLSTTNTVLLFVLLGLLGTFLTQFGDLVSSAYKRKVGIKDFGSIFPGHGGFMDRVDGLMFTGTLVYVLFALFI